MVNLPQFVDDQLLTRLYKLASLFSPDSQFNREILAHGLDLYCLEIENRKRHSRFDAMNPSTAEHTDEQLLQMCVLRVCERYEREQEGGLEASGLSQDDMILRWIKHLVVLGRKNSFRTTISMVKILHLLPQKDVRTVYEELRQSGRVAKGDDSQYRREKGKVLKELLARFGAFLAYDENAPDGSDNFVRSATPINHDSLAEHALAQLSPYGVDPPVIPPANDRRIKGIPDLRSDNRYRDNEMEVARQFALIDPATCAALFESLGFGHPSETRSYPVFVDPKSSEPLPDSAGRKDLDGPSDRDLRFIRKRFEEVSTLRRRLSLDCLSAVIDGEPRSLLDLSESSSTRFSVTGDDDYLEVWDSGENKVLLAVAELALEPLDQHDFTIRFGVGQELKFRFSETKGSTEFIHIRNVDIQFRETRILRIFRRWLRMRLRLRAFPGVVYARMSGSKTDTSGRKPDNTK